MTTHDEKNTVATVIEDWSKAIGNKNAAQVLAHLADDVVQFTLAPPLRGKAMKTCKAGSIRGKDQSALNRATWRLQPATI